MQPFPGFKMGSFNDGLHVLFREIPDFARHLIMAWHAARWSGPLQLDRSGCQTDRRSLFSIPRRLMTGTRERHSAAFKARGGSWRPPSRPGPWPRLARRPLRVHRVQIGQWKKQLLDESDVSPSPAMAPSDLHQAESRKDVVTHEIRGTLSRAARSNVRAPSLVTAVRSTSSLSRLGHNDLDLGPDRHPRVILVPLRNTSLSLDRLFR